MDNNLPQFDQIDIKNLKQNLSTLLDEQRNTIHQLLQQPSFTWQNLMQPLDNLDDQLHQFWSPVSHLNSVRNNEEIRQSYNDCLPLLSEFSTEMGQNKALFQAIQSLTDLPEYQDYSAAQQQVIKHNLQDFTLAGIALPEQQQLLYKEICKQLSELSAKFEQQLMDASNAWQKHITSEKPLAGIPQYALDMFAQAAAQKELDGYLITLDFPHYYAVITYADDRQLRQEIYTAFVTRASDQGPNANQFDNAPIIDQILALRHELSKLLEFNNYAEKSLVKKMANSPQQVLDFLNDLAQKTKPQAEQDVQALAEFSKQHCQLDQLEAWDIAYCSEKFRQQQYDISDQQVRPYFPVNKVIEGMFDIVNRLYGIRLEKIDGINTWHPDVTFYHLYDEDGSLRGQLYMDLYAREKKRGGAWMDDCQGRRRLSDDTIQTPIAFLTCNFTPPVGDKPALLSHDEVQTLFHEFGHCLHHLLTKVDYLGVSGINGVAWDAVELPSQFFENWCWEWDGLQIISRHVETGEPLPKALFDKLQAAKNFQAAMQLIRQLEFALFDFHCHLDCDPHQSRQWQTILDTVRQHIAVIKPPAFNRFAQSFSHIFAGGYAAGYYSYLWAEVLSADAFSLFEETGIFNPETGQAFLQHILQQGGSAEPLTLFKRFRGREPKIDALLRHRGIKSGVA